MTKLSHLSVRDFAIVESVDIEFGEGMTVLTGETGAGKSILVDALSLAVGERASAEFVRPGGDRADITAVFELGDYRAARDWLEEQSLDESNDECILRRTLTADGRSKAFINGRPVPVHTLRSLGDLLVDIHGQHEHQSVLKRDTQRHLLDEFAGHAKLLGRVAELASDWQQLNSELHSVSGPGGDTNARLELLNYQVDELSQFAPQAGELQTLDQELKRLANITTMTETCSQLLEQLAGPDSPAVLSVLQTGSRELDNLPDDDPKLLAAAELLATAGISLQEAVNDLRSYTDALEPDPTRITEIEQRLSSAHDLARKHRISADELDATLSNLRGEIDALAVNEGLVESLNQRMTDVRSNYLNAAKKLSDSRTRAANKLGLAVSKQLKVLGMSGSVFTITVEEETDAVRSHGTDQVEFMVSTNPGQPALPLARVVSGGELSRISLALQVVTTGGTGIPTIIFDEVDVGIGGNIAEVVGQHMHGLARHRQVLCVTHLPQVASQADAHVQVQKKTTKTRVQTRFEKLADDGRVEEIARMLGGLEITAQTRAHAREMLARD